MTIVIILSLFPISNANAQSQPSLAIKILSPTAITDYPGKQVDVIASVTNQSDHTIKDLMVYITMADWGKHSTVNLEDFSANTPVRLDSIKAGVTKQVTLPIRFVYTSKYDLYVTATTTENLDIYSSSAIPIEILGNTKISPLQVQLVAAGIPAILLILLLMRLWSRKKKV